jgi:hypothetical protein
MAEKPVLHLEELNLRVPGGWLVFIWTPGRNGLGGATFYPDPDHTWDGGTQ